MAGEMIEFGAEGRLTPGYVATPPSGHGPGLVVIQEYWGLVGHIRNIADRFAAAGFVALAPDLYHGRTTKSPDEAGKLLMALNIRHAARDMRGAGDYLLSLSSVAPKKVGIVGFCMGGQLALFAACEHPDRFSATVDFYGYHPKANADVTRLDGPVLLHFGLDDPLTKRDDANALVQRMLTAGKRVEVYFYRAGHAFFNDERPEAYSPESAELAWNRTIEFLRQGLSEDGRAPSPARASR